MRFFRLVNAIFVSVVLTSPVAAFAGTGYVLELRGRTVQCLGSGGYDDAQFESSGQAVGSYFGQDGIAGNIYFDDSKPEGHYQFVDKRGPELCKGRLVVKTSYPVAKTDWYTDRSVKHKSCRSVGKLKKFVSR